jgi:NarL family two-component system response regulator LiaR
MSRKIRVLIADDHALVRDGIRELLARYDDISVVGVAGDGLEAIRLTNKTKPDVVIMDIRMPRLDGIQATIRIQRLWPTTGVLLLTEYDDATYVMGLLEAGAAGYLLKTTHKTQLVEAVRAVREGEAIINSSVLRKLLTYMASRRRAGSIDRQRKCLYSLSGREMKVLGMAAAGMSNRDIAARLSVTIGTVKAHLHSIFNKMGVASRTAAIVEAITDGTITSHEYDEDEYYSKDVRPTTRERA